MNNRVRIKVCCISSWEEAQTAIAKGADALGLVGHMPSGPGVISDETIHFIASHTPPPISTFLLTSETSAQEVIAHHQKVHTHTIQLVDAVEEGTYAEIKQALPHVKIVQVIHVLGEETLSEALALSKEVDALLLDSGNPNLAIKQLGGTGRTHDWGLSREIVRNSSVPVFLAGGLHAGNVREAIKTVKPYGLDLCSGVRTGGNLDPTKLASFIQAAYG